MAGPNKRLPTQERKAQILGCAARVFARSNYQKATTAEIAAEAGISEATIYSHFPSKRALFIEILQQMEETTALTLQEEVNKEHDALKVLRNIVGAFHSLMASHPDEVKVKFQAVAQVHDKEIADLLYQDHKKYMRLVRGLIEKGIKQGTVRKLLDIDTIVLLFDGVGAFMHLMHILPFEAQSNEESVLKMVDGIIDSIRA
jgi:AcrR family transcriptional regulator